jgi:hypothetical protein
MYVPSVEQAWVFPIKMPASLHYPNTVGAAKQAKTSSK